MYLYRPVSGVAEAVQLLRVYRKRSGFFDHHHAFRVGVCFKGKIYPAGKLVVEKGLVVSLVPISEDFVEVPYSTLHHCKKEENI